MRTLFYLSESQLERIKPFFPSLSRGVPVSMTDASSAASFTVTKHGLEWKDAPDEYSPYKTLYNRFVR